ncbi:MAG: FKBP-type peptidyl-prolyl cis-trans isomerase [Cytophagaceae bacterium]|nr:FKBP-type peptidyl-prolyl cis-trans isomerase [Cytophagaceae bacterium]
MKKVFLVACSFSVAFAVSAQTKKPPPRTAPKPAATAKPAPANSAVLLKTQNDSLSYAIGVNLGQNFRNQNLQGISGSTLGRAVDNVLKGQKTLLSPDQAAAILNTYSTKMREQQMKEQAKQFEPNKKAGEAYLAANKSKDSVVTLPSGLQYKILKKGEGPKPTANDRVKTHYHGTLIDGNVFDSSVQRNEPISFAVTGVIPGWTEALQLMPVGSKWRLFIPYQLAYGEPGSAPTIQPYSALIFDVELLAIELQKANQATPGKE